MSESQTTDSPEAEQLAAPAASDSNRAPKPLSPEQLSELLGLLKGADSVELKLTVPDHDRRSAMIALGMDPMDAQIRQVVFYDTPDLALNKSGVVVRARRVQGREADSVVKLRPVVPDELPPELRAASTCSPSSRRRRGPCWSTSRVRRRRAVRPDEARELGFRRPRKERAMSKMPKIAGIISVISGVVMIVVGVAVFVLVQNELADENITVSEDAENFAGEQVDGPLTAYAQADVIKDHALEAGGGKTYAELDRDDPARDTVMNASFLRASLFTSVVAFGVATLVVGLGVLMILIGLALVALAKREAQAVVVDDDHVDSPPPPPPPPSDADAPEPTPV